MCRKVVLLVCFVLLLGLVGKAPAADRMWIGGSSSDTWCEPANWDPGAIPGPGDTAVSTGAPQRGPIVGVGCDANVGSITLPTRNDQVMDVTGGTLICHGDWRWADDDDATAVINITAGDVNVLGGVKLADSDGAYGTVRITGGTFACGSFNIGDDGEGMVQISGDAVVTVRGTLDLGGLGGLDESDRGMDVDIVVDVNLTASGSLTVGGTFEIRTSPVDTATVIINLDAGTVECGGFSHGGPYSMDINEGVLKISGDYVAAIEEDISLGYITGYNGTQTPTAMFDGQYTWVGVGLVQVKAWNPSPSNNATNVCPNGVTLSWSPGEYAADVNGHDIYFGTSPNDVNENADPSFAGYDTNSLPLPTLESGETYYWRIDEVNDGNTWTGEIWQFTTQTGQAFDPSPADGFIGLSPDANELSWTASCIADGHKVYFGTSWSGVNDGTAYIGEQSLDDTNYAPTLEQFTQYYWRVDEVNDGNDIRGDIWGFKTGYGGLLMYYKFDDGQGNDLPSPITDDSGNSIQFTKYTGAGGSLTYGESSPVVADSTASADFVPEVGLYRLDTGQNDPLRLAGWQYTIEMWVKAERLDDDMDIDDDDPEAEWLEENWDVILIGKFDSWMIGIEDPGENNAFWWEHAGNGESMSNDSAVVGEWTHVAVVYDRTNENGQQMQFYRNGVLEESTDEGDLNPADNNYPVTIGYIQRDDVTLGRFWDGLIDEVRIYDVALTACEFQLFPGPEWASCPSPYDGKVEQDPCVVALMWTPGEGMVHQELYFSSDIDEVSGAGATAVETTYGPNSWTLPSTLANGTVYYWRVDTYNGSQTYEGVVWRFTTRYVIEDEHLILYYKFDETTGDTAVDASGYGHHGAVDGPEGNWEPTGGRFDGCRLFDSDTAVFPPTTVTTHVTNQISISVWLNGMRDQRVRDHVILDVSTGENAPYAMRVLVPDDSRNVVWRAGNDTNDMLVWDTATPRGWEGDWHHFVFIKDEGNDVMQIYFDADLVKDKAGTLSTLSNLLNNPFKIGAYIWHSYDYEGRMDDLRIYDRAISKSKVEQLFRGGNPALAWKPRPYDGQPDAPVTTDLTWRPGDYAADPNAHEVYFGTSWDDVNDANNSWPVGTSVYKGPHNLDANNYDPPGLLDLGQTYYWRIDEVNDANNDRWKGKVWTFAVAEYITIDDMEDCDNVSEGWWYGADTWSGGDMFNQTTPPVRGDLTMKYMYYNLGPDWGMGYFSEMQTKNLDPNDWTTYDIRILSLWFYGDADNASTGVEQMYVLLEDYDGNTAEVRYGDGEDEDVNDITIEEWQEWGIFTSDLTDVNLADLYYLAIGFGQRYWSFPGGYGYVYFDDIRLYQSTCIPERLKPAADISNNCIVDWEDIEIMADDWLESDVNLGEVVKPDANGLVGWWKLDDGDGNVVADYAGYDHNGVIETIDVNVSWVDGRDGNALEFDGGRVRVQDAAALRPMDQLSVCAWVFYSETHDENGRVVVKGPDNKETFSLEVSRDDKLNFHVRDGNDPNLSDFPRYEVDSNELDQGEWIHLAGTYDGNSVKCYVNGNLEGTNSDANEIVFLSQDSNDLAIGSMCDDDRAPFMGTIDDVRLYNYALSLEEIRYLATDGTKVFSVQSVANLYNEEDLGKRAVNFRDFAVIADSWLEKKLWPE